MPCKRIVNGRVVYWPERCDIGNTKILLDPNLTPMENCWRIIKIVTLIRLTMFKIFAYDYGDMADLETMVQIATYNRLRDMVKNGEYNRDYSFYLNVRASCYSIAQHVVDKWMADIRQRYNNLDGNGIIGNSEHGTLTLFDSLAAHKVPRLMTNTDFYNKYRYRHWFDYDRPCDRTKVLRAETYRAYDEYCDDCLLFNITDVLSYDDFVKQNYTEEEQKVIAKPIYGVKANKSHAKAGRPRLAPTETRPKAEPRRKKTPEERLEAKKSYQHEWYLRRRANMSEAELEAKRAHDRAYQNERNSRLTPEQREAKNAYNREYNHTHEIKRTPRKRIDELEPEQREAKRKYYREWYVRNKERLMAYAAEYRAANRDRIRQYSKDWYAKQKEKAVT